MVNNPFSSGSLGSLTSDYNDLDTDSVSDILRESDLGSRVPCYICSNEASHKMVPKRPEYNSAFVQDKGYICDMCLTKGYLDKNAYGVRKLK